MTESLLKESSCRLTTFYKSKTRESWIIYSVWERYM